MRFQTSVDNNKQNQPVVFVQPAVFFKYIKLKIVKNDIFFLAFGEPYQDNYCS